MKTFGIKFLDGFLSDRIDEQEEYSRLKMRHTVIYDDIYLSLSEASKDIINKFKLSDYIMFDSEDYCFALVTVDEREEAFYLHPLFMDDIAFIWPLKGIGTFEYHATIDDLENMATTSIIQLDLPDEDLKLLSMLPTLEPSDIIRIITDDGWYVKEETMLDSKLIDVSYKKALSALLQKNDTYDYGLPSVFQAFELDRKLKLNKLNNHYASAKLKAWEQIAEHSHEFQIFNNQFDIKYIKEKGD